jgi:Protein of unknown function (DUF1247)
MDFELRDRIFRADLAQLTKKILNNQPPDPDSKLGDIILYLNENKLLLTRKKDENFEIKESIDLSVETRDYLNALQTEKFNHCRLCYHKDQNLVCDFHKKYIFTKDSLQYHDEYTNFLNSEMGIISMVELYYTYMTVDFWRITGQYIFRDLTGFMSVKSLLQHYNYPYKANVDEPAIECMDTIAD